jgi:hypothetical protein
MAKIEIKPVKPEEFQDLINKLKALDKAYEEASTITWKDFLKALILPIPFTEAEKILKKEHFDYIRSQIQYHISVLERNYEANQRKGLHDNILRSTLSYMEALKKELEMTKGIFEKVRDALFKTLINLVTSIKNTINEILKRIGETAKTIYGTWTTLMKLLPFIIVGGLGLTGFIIYKALKSEKTREFTKQIILKKI